MSPQRDPVRKPAVVERRSVAATLIQRSAAGAALRSPGQALQQRLGNGGTQALISRAVVGPAPVVVTTPVGTQFARVSQPGDPAEKEAKETARNVVAMAEPKPQPVAKTDEEMKKKPVAQREIATMAAATAPAAVAAVGGSPLPSAVRSFMEPRFGADFGRVRIHTGAAAAQQSAALNANAFTVGEHIYFGRDKFQPQSAGGQELIAHELTHTIQQGAAIQRDVVQRSAAVHVAERVTPHVQRGFLDFLGIPSPREYFAGKAANIPGYTMLTVVIGFNPISGARVERSAGNILRGAIQLIPGGKLITDALESHGIFDRVSQWAATQFEALKGIGATIWDEVQSFISGFKLTSLRDPGALWDRARAIVERPIERIKAFAVALKDGIVGLIKSAILNPIAAFARTTSGYSLLCTVMGKDPITGEPVAQDPGLLLGGFMKFIGEEELWNTMQKAQAIPRAFAWFKGAVGAALGFVSQIPTLFVQAFKALDLADIILIPRAFMKLAGVFGNFAVRFITWGASAVWTLLEIIFDVVSPGALAYIKKTGAALKSILRNPLPFVGNLVKAAKQGFLNFADNFLDHLKAGLIDWLTGSLPGIYIPKAFSLGEIAKFAFSALGLTWANIRQKLVKATSETVVKTLETGFDIVVALVRDGPAAAWDKIKEQLANLKDMVIGGITDFVVDMVVKKAIPKLVAMFIPGAGFISAILSIYDTIMVFVNKIKQIVQVVTGFIDSLVAIAAGQIGAAASRVEKSLAGVLSLAINFLAGFAGLGKVADKVMGVIQKIRAPVDKALDWLVDWIVKAAKTLFAKGKAAVGKVIGWAFATKTFKDSEGKQHQLYVSDAGGLTVESAPQAAEAFVDWYATKRTLDPALVSQVKGKIKEAKNVIAEIDKGKKKDPAANFEGKQRTLLALNTEITGLLSRLIGRDPKAADIRKKYLLEGQVGTYASMPKPVGDKLTPDHQPQASIILGAADFFRKILGISGGNLAKRAADRAAQGYAINLHFKRHVAGATYGSKGETREGFTKRLEEAAAGQKPDAAKKTAVALLRGATKTDVKRMKDVAAFDISHDAWKQLSEEIKDKEEAKKLKDEIAGRIVQGEDQIASQPFDF